jgi:Xaa-Pro aminopeptidase
MEERYMRRTAELQQRMRDDDIDAVLLTDPDSITYLAGYWGYLGMEWGRPTMVFVPQAGECSVITPLMESEMGRNLTWIADVRPWEDGVDGEWRKPLAELLGPHGSMTLGVERTLMHPRINAYVVQDHPELRLSDVALLLGPMRQIKDADEIDIMRQAGQVAVAMVEGARAAIAPDVPEYEVALAVINAGTRKAAEFLGVEGVDQYHSPTVYNLQVLQSGAHTCMVHRRSSVRRLQTGDPVYLCFCGIANFKQYKLGFDREFFVGSVTDEQARTYETAIRAQLSALDSVRPGAVAEDVHSAADTVYREAGFTPGYRTGRSIGCSFLEQPELKSGDKTVLKAGMTFAVDGGITLPGEYGVRVGDSIVVTDAGFEYLTPYPKTLTVL